MLSRTHFQENFQEHFNVEGHNGFLDYVSIILFDQTDASDPERQKNY